MFKKGCDTLFAITGFVIGTPNYQWILLWLYQQAFNIRIQGNDGHNFYSIMFLYFDVNSCTGWYGNSKIYLVYFGLPGYLSGLESL